jgi:hypothetical protein
MAKPSSPTLQNRSEALKISIGMAEDEIRILKPMMDAAAVTIQCQYHRLQAKRKYEWKKNLHIHRSMMDDLKKIDQEHALCVLQAEEKEEKEEGKEKGEEEAEEEQTQEDNNNASSAPPSTLATNASEVLNFRQNSILLHAHCACMLIQATYRSYRSRLHLKWIQATMHLVLSRQIHADHKINWAERTIVLPHTVIAQGTQKSWSSVEAAHYLSHLSNNNITKEQQNKAATLIQKRGRMLLSQQKMKWKQVQSNAIQSKRRTERKKQQEQASFPECKESNGSLESVETIPPAKKYTYTESPVEDVF